MNYQSILYVLNALQPVLADENTPDGVRSWAQSIQNKLSGPLEPIAKFVKGSPVPAGIGALADEYSEVRKRRLELDKEAAAVKERESEISKLIMSALSESTDTGASGEVMRVQLVQKKRYNVTDWAQVHAFIAKNNLFELMQKRLADKAVADLAEEYAGQLPPGIEEVDVPTLSFNKV